MYRLDRCGYNYFLCKMTNRFFLLTLAIVGASMSTEAQVYVKSNASGLNDGTSWQNAYTDLSAAIHATASGQVWVAAGIYLPTTDYDGQIPTNPRFKTFKFKKGVAIYGGFAGTESGLSER